MLDAALTAQLTAHFEKITRPVEIVMSLDDGAKSTELTELLTEIASLSEHISLERRDDDPRRPSFAITRLGTDVSVRFAGIPSGHEFTSLVLAVLQVGGHPSTASAEVIEQIEALEGEYAFETYLSLECQNCPEVVQALNLMSVLNPNVTHVAIDGALFRDEVEARRVMAVPTVFLNGELFDQGRMSLEEIVAKLDAGVAARVAGQIDDKEAFDVLVIGGGPAGATSAIYAARKGIRTGIVAERFGGQVLDTMAIENFISVPYTEGPKFAAALEQHVREYDVDLMNLQRAAALIPASEPGGPVSVELESGAVVRSRTVVLSTGARWRHMGVPGEDEYRNRGVTYCPHCDGPLFKGKRVAVIGGGNSGVEAAIDLAGVVAHVTLIEFDDALRADEVLQRKLRSLPNTTTILGASTTEVQGDGEKVTGLVYEDRASGDRHTVALDGVFVQIGLLPNTEWLDGAVERSPRGEVVVDDRGGTSVPGVFAAGDCTTTPYKQIVVAMGAGSTAALSAFDHLIRTSAPAATDDDAFAATGPSLSAVNLRDLGYLVAVAEERHFGRAADACFVSQPTLSTQIKKLEKELGVELIERNPGRVLLTDAGERVVERARVILAETENIRSIARQAQDPESGSVRLGLFPTIAPYLLPHVVPHLHHRFPNLELLLVEEKTEVVLQQLRDGLLDAVIVALPVQGDQLHEEFLFAEDFVLAVPADHALAANREPVDVSVLAREHVLLLEEGHCLREQALAVCRLAGASERGGFRATSLETLRQMVAAGVGVTLLPELAVQAPVPRSEDIALLRFADPVPQRRIAMLWRDTSVYRDFLPKLAEVIRDLPSGLVHRAAPGG